MNSVAVHLALACEKSIADLMLPASTCLHVYEDEPVRRVIKVLAQSPFRAVPGNLGEEDHRSVLVFSRQDTFLGCIRQNDVLDLLVPQTRRESHAPFEARMFVARCKLLGSVTVGEILGEQRFVDVEAPLAEAVHLMAIDGLTELPVLREGNLVGVLTARILLQEIREVASSCAGSGVLRRALRLARVPHDWQESGPQST